MSSDSSDGRFQMLRALYNQLDARIAEHQPRCEASGRCCRFIEYGHTLFLSQWEADYLLESGVTGSADPASCPYQVEGLCTARQRRPIGCRVYFCDPNFADQQVRIAEEFTTRLKRLHESQQIPWHYAPLHHFLGVPCRTSEPGRKDPMPGLVDLS